jgi:DNA-binding transcriptional LysR family regulator
VSGELAYETIRSERIVALLPAGHPRARDGEVALGALAGDPLVLFPRELAPRLYELFIAICRRAGFEPAIRTESFHTSWELGVLGDVPGVALVPESVTRETPRGMIAVELSDPADHVETAVVWRKDDASASVAAFREVARTVFAVEPGAA